jgi:predicted transcriptional regulator
MDEDLTKEAYRVLLYLCGRLQFENFIQIKQSDICEALKIKKQNVSRAVKLLLGKGIIERHPDVGNAYAFRLNPTYGYKGDPRGKVVSLGDGRAAFHVIEGGQSTTNKPEH